MARSTKQIPWQAKRWGAAPKIGSDAEKRRLLELLQVIKKDKDCNKLKALYSQKMTQLEFDSCVAGETTPDGKPYPWQWQFHNAGAQYKQRGVIANNQGGKCVSPSQLIDLYDGTKKPACKVEVGDAVKSWDGNAVVPGKVSAIVHKPAEPIVRISLRGPHGESSLETVLGHRWLTASGWQYVSSSLLDRFGVLDSRLTQALDDLHSKTLAIGFQSCYPENSGSCDALLRLVQGDGQCAFPSLDDVPKRSLFWFGVDDLSNRYNDILSTFSRHLSSLDEAIRFWVRSVLSRCRTLYSVGTQYQDYSPTPSPLHEAFDVDLQSAPSTHPHQDRFASLLSPYNKGGRCDSIIGYDVLDPQPLIDFTIDGYHNYIAGGVVNHNTRSCGAELSCHATGWYPEWWEGQRFTEPIKACVGSNTNETLRDPIQLELYGGFEPESRNPDGMGWIPKSAITNVSFRQCGLAGVFDEVQVKHASGGVSSIKHKTYEQGWTKWQGTQFDIYWLDEEPENDDRIFSEVLRGLLARDGMLLFSRTPLFGMTQIIRHFMQDSKTTTYYKNVTLDDSPHITEEKKQEFLADIPEHEVECRSKGIPMLGEGAIYPIGDDQLKVEPFAIPRHWRRIVGLDFGHTDHPTAAVWLAHNTDTDIIYVYDVYKKGGKTLTVATHAHAIHSRGFWIPVAWPHDGMQGDRAGSGKNMMQNYKACHVNMLHESARYDDDKGGAQARDPIIQHCYERMVSGRLKVFSHLQQWFEEKRMYHRKNGMVVAVNDDLMSGTHYGVMSRRYARAEYRQQAQPTAIDSDPLQEFHAKPTRQNQYSYAG